MNTDSQHLLADFWLEGDLKPHTMELIDKYVYERFNVLHKTHHKFEPDGETILYILAESHVSIHTYPEHQYFSLDIYICRMDIDMDEVFERLYNIVEPRKYKKKLIIRGESEKSGVVSLFKNHKFHLVLTTIVAMCSLLYELLLAQTLSTIMGDTTLRYSVTIGLYIAAMGVGALTYERLKPKDKNKRLISIELALAAIGGTAPILVLAFDSIFQRLSMDGSLGYYSDLAQMCLWTFNHLMIVIIGLISGWELPLLMEIGEDRLSGLGGKVLAFDYLGSLLGSICFPLLLIPFFDLFHIGFIVATLNLLVAFVMCLKLGRNGLGHLLATSGFVAVACIALLNQDALETWIINTFYFIQ